MKIILYTTHIQKINEDHIRLTTSGVREWRITLRWYFLCKDCRTRPVYIPHIHQAKSRPSQIKNVVLGSIPWMIAVPAANARPPSIQTAWQMHGVVHGVSSLKLSTFRPKRTQGQNSPVQPVQFWKKKKIQSFSQITWPTENWTWMWCPRKHYKI